MQFPRFNIVSLQRSDHERMESLLRRYQLGEHEHAAFRDIVALVTKHAFAEEAVLFPALRKYMPNAEALTADVERKHHAINELLISMRTLAPSDPVFEARARSVFALLRADAHEEETIVLPALASVTSVRQREVVGLLWAAVRLVAPSEPHPRVPRRPPANWLAALPLAAADRVRGLLSDVRGVLAHRT